LDTIKSRLGIEANFIQGHLDTIDLFKAGLLDTVKSLQGLVNTVRKTPFLLLINYFLALSKNSCIFTVYSTVFCTISTFTLPECCVLKGAGKPPHIYSLAFFCIILWLFSFIQVEILVSSHITLD